MYRNTGSRRTRLFMVFTWMLVLSFLVYPSQNIAAQSNGERLYLPSVVTADDGESGDTTAITRSATAATAAGAFSTRESRMAAKPLIMPGVDLAQVAAQSTNDEAIGAPSLAPGGQPDSSADLQASTAFAVQWALADADADTDVESSAALSPTAVDGTDNVYTTYRGNYYKTMWRKFPYRATGKLYFTTWNGVSNSCSASVISPNNIIVTAAHCLYDTDANRWQSNWVFVPAERDYAAPYGTFEWDRGQVLPEWMNAASYSAGIRYDVGLLQLRNNSSGNSVTFYTGYLGRSRNLNYVQNQTEIGYPDNLPTGDEYTYVSHSESFNHASGILGYGSNMGYGASGSPLIMRFAPGVGGNYVNGVQSGSWPNGSSPTFSVAARFTDSTIGELCTKLGC